MDEDSPAGMIWIGSPPTAPLPRPPRFRLRRSHLLLIGAGVAVLLVLGAAWGGSSVARRAASAEASASPSASPRTQVFRMFGYVDLGRAEFAWDDKTNTCWGWSGYDDIHEGTPVVVTDATGTTVAVSKLGPGRPLGMAGKVDGCEFAWEVLGVPDGSAFYAVEISHRGKVQRSRAEITSRFDLGFN